MFGKNLVHRWAAPIALLLVGGLITSGVWIAQSPAQAPTQAQQHAKSLSQAFRAAAEATMPAVVKIQSVTRWRAPRPLNPGAPRLRGENPFKGTPFEDFFNDGLGGRGLGIPQRQAPRSGVGSGVIIDASGVILTNYHVVEDADDLYVFLSDGREFKATDVKTDPATDLAVVRIKVEEKLPVARLGDSDRMAIGDWVIAVGHPFELEATVSAGIISGKGRSLESVGRARFLQTDAAINPGNSGGPLVNLDGEIVGINTAIATSNGGYQGIGFAIPSNLAKWVSQQLVTSGKVQRAYLGVSIEKVDASLARQFNVRSGHGVLVTQVHADTPAAKAGFKEGDVIVAFASAEVHGPRDLQAIVERSGVGKTFPVQVLRDGKSVTLRVTLEALPDTIANSRPDAIQRDGSSDNADTHKDETLQIEVSNLSAAVARRLGYDGFAGVLITQVDPNSVAYRKGVREGMLIMTVDRKPVTSVEEYRDATKDASLKKGVLLKLRAGDSNRYLVLEER